MNYTRLTERVGKGISVKETSTNDNRSIWNAIERLAELEDKIEHGTLIEFPRITETVYGLEWTVEYVSNTRTGIGIAKVFCGTEEQAKAILEIVKKYGYPKQEKLDKLQELQE